MKITVEQVGVGPVTLDLGPDAPATNVATAPTDTTLLSTDLVLIQRAGQVQKLVATALNVGALQFYGNGPPAAGSGVPGQSYIDLAGHAAWLNVAGTWFQVGVWSAPAAAPIPPPSSMPTILMNFSVATRAAYVAALF